VRRTFAGHAGGVRAAPVAGVVTASVPVDPTVFSRDTGPVVVERREL
jgi:hypothetical protein